MLLLDSIVGKDFLRGKKKKVSNHRRQNFDYFLFLKKILRRERCYRFVAIRELIEISITSR